MSEYNERKDFYFSSKGLAFSRNTRNFDGSRYVEARFNGKRYTECIDVGGNPITSHYGDLVFLGTGSFGDCTYE